MPSNAADLTVQYGLLALRTGLIDEDQLRTGFRSWARDKVRPLAEHFSDLGALDRDQLALLEDLSSQHLKKHGGDIEKSLAALPVERSTRENLAGVGDPDLSTTLPSIATDPFATLSFAGPDRAGDSAGGPESGHGRRFRILRPHAQGGLGAVFMALDRELHREVALKQILERHADDPGSRARFLLEAEITGGLEHPGIVPVYGLGTDADGRPYYAMRFIKGDSLKQAIDGFHGDEGLGRDPGRRSLELRKLLRRFTDVCNAVDYAHSRGVLHRDIKPGNIVVGKHGETLVIDWGLAKATGWAHVGVMGDERPLAPSSASGSAETAPGSALGTPAYMSPEQAAGELERLGPRSDVYSLGATLYCLLAGRPPFEGDVFEVIVAVRRGEYARPRQVDPNVDRALEAICVQAMALEPEARYATPRDLAEDIERWMADEAVSAWREPWPDRLRRWGRRNRTLTATAATAALAALVGLAVVATVQAQGRQQLSIKNEQLTSANQARGRALDKANARVDLALQALGKFRETVDANLDVKNRPENASLRKELLQTPLAFFRTLRDDLRNDPAARPEDGLKLADAQLELARLTGGIGNQAAALDTAREAVAALDALATDRGATAVPDQARRKLLEAIRLLASLQLNNGQRDEGRKTLDRGVRLGESVVSEAADLEPRLELARLLSASASADDAAQRSDVALASLGRARSLLDGGDVVPDRQLNLTRLRAQLLEQTARLLEDAGKPGEAIENLMAAIRLFRPLAEGPNPDWESRDLLAEVYMTIGRNRSALGRATEALEEYRRALGVRRAMLAERPADLSNRLRTVRCLRLIAETQSAMGQDETSLEGLREARGLLEPARLENPRSVRVLKGLTDLHSATGTSLYGLGRIAESLASFEQEVSILEEVVRIEPQVIQNRADLAGSLYNIAVLRNGLGRYESSLEADFAALAIRRKLAAEFPDVPSHRLELAASLGNIGATITLWKKDYAAALAYYRDASSVLEDLTRSHPDVVEHSEYLSRSRTNIAGLLSTLGRFDEALAVGQAAGDYLEGRVRAEPQLMQARLDFAFNLDQRAEACLRLRRYAEADRLNRRAIENVLTIPEGSRATPEAVRSLANCFGGLGVSAAFRGRFEEAVEQYSRSIAAAQPDGKTPPEDNQVRGKLRNALEGRAEAHARLGQVDAARADWSRLASIREPGEPDLAPLGPILIRAWSGEAAGFLADSQAAVVAGALTKDQLVTLARAACLAISNVGSNAALTDRLGATAMAWLLSAQADGVFASQGAWKVLIDPRFDTIALRPEFRDLKADLTFPTQPFASGTTAP